MRTEITEIFDSQNMLIQILKRDKSHYLSLHLIPNDDRVNPFYKFICLLI